MTNKKHVPKNVVKERWIAYVQIVLGCVIGGLGYPLFMAPNQIAPGGLSGVATILHHLFQFPIGITTMILNIPLFLIGYRAMGRVFVFRSIIATVLFSVTIDVMQFPPLTKDPLLATLYGGIFLGVGVGLILRGGATTGGSDMVARMVHRRYPAISVGIFLFAIDFTVVLGAAIFLGLTEALYAFICIFVASKLVDIVLTGLSSNKACFVISEKWQNISERVLKELERGATFLKAKGAYSNEEKPMLLCVMGVREVQQMKKIVHEEDAHAFMFIADAHETLGEGFNALNGDD